MLILIVQCLLSIALVGVLTKLFTKTDLDNIRGPKSESLVKVPMFKDVTKKIDILHWMSRAALEMIGQSGLGCSFDSLEESATPHPFVVAVKAFGPATSKLLFQREYILPTVVKIGSPQFRRWLLDLLPFRSLRTIRDMIDILDRTTTEIYETKKQAMKEGVTPPKQSSEAKDLISILMKANIEAPEEDRLPDKEVLAQDKLRVEVTEALKEHNGDIPYDDLVSLPFMDAVCRETLRLARKDMILPLSTPVKGLDGREMQSILVPKNTKIFISIFNANRDPLLWGPDSLEWKPERWLSPLPEAVHDAHIPGIYSHLSVLTIRSNVEGGLISLSMTFLGGGRACIGFKFSQLEMKVVLSMLIANFRFFPPEKEIIWKMTPVTTPTVAESPAYPQLPLKMEVISPKPVL
ncbi:hypothetical protein C0989_012573 [Termitomyces sp. Mn162]|nr:hypothetical protein C0989_012573 [Termitomyces sp. Mn162]